MASIEGVNVDHHGGRAMDSGPMVGKEFLGPSAKLVARGTVSGNLPDCVAIADPVEMGAPKIGVEGRKSPAAASYFTNKGMVIGFGGRTAAGGRIHGLETGRSEGSIEGD